MGGGSSKPASSTPPKIEEPKPVPKEAMGSGSSKPAPSPPPRREEPKPVPKEVLYKEPWRKVPWDVSENLDFLKSYQPCNGQAKHLRILLYGPVGAGKSSFINSVESILRNRITGRAPTDAASDMSFTKTYKTYKIRSGEGNTCSFVFNDIMGLERYANHGVNVEDLKQALKGHMRDDYQFNPIQALGPDNLHYNSSPTLDDKVHVLVCVAPANALSLLSDEIVRKMRDVRLAASELGIPQMGILTKVDEACAETKKDLRNVHKSIWLKEKVDQMNKLLGFQVNYIFPVKNYILEIELNDETSALILYALRQMIKFGEDFLDDQQTASCLSKCCMIRA